MSTKCHLCFYVFGLLCGLLALIGDESLLAAPLPPPAPVQGSVVDNHDQPVSGATIFLPNTMMGSIYVSHSALTNAASQFTLPTLFFGGQTVIVEASDGSLTFAALPRRNAGLPRFQLSPSTTLRLRFIDARNQPLIGRQVVVFPSPDPHPIDGTVGTLGFPQLPEALQSRLGGQTDSHGILTLPGLPQGQRVAVTIAAGPPGRPIVLNGSVLLQNKPVTTGPPIHIFLNGEITGRVIRYSTGRPLANAQVSLIGPGYHNWMASTRTDVHGDYRFTGLFPANYNEYLDAAWDPQGRRLDQAMTRSPQGGWLRPFLWPGIQLKPGQQVRAPDIGAAHSAVITCKVIGTDGRPQFGAYVEADIPSGGGSGRMTGVDGTCRLAVRPGPVRVIWDSDRATERVIQERNLNLLEGQEVSVVFSRAPRGKASPLRALAPDFAVKDTAGNLLHLADFRGKALVLIFWIVEINPLELATLTHINTLLAGSADPRLVGLAIASEDNDPSALAQWQSQHPALTSLRFASDPRDPLDGQEIPADAYTATGWPAVFVIAPDGTLVAQWDDNPDDASLRQAITAALSVKPLPSLDR